MQRRTFLIRSLLLSAPASVACRRGSGKVVGVVPRGASALFWQSVSAGAHNAGDDLRVEILWDAPADETDVAGQIRIVESMLRRPVDGIALGPSDPVELVGVVNRAVDAGIPVSILESAIETDRWDSFVATDHFAAGRLAARAVADALGGAGGVAVLRCAPALPSTLQREKGFKAALAEDHPKIRIVVQRFCQANRLDAQQTTREMLAEDGDFGAFFSSTQQATIGAMRALRLQSLAGEVKLVGVDATFSQQQGLRDGVIEALVVQDPYYIGYMGVKTVVQKRNGLTPPRWVDSPVRLVTATNLDHPDVRQLLIPEVRRAGAPPRF